MEQGNTQEDLLKSLKLITGVELNTCLNAGGTPEKAELAKIQMYC